MKSQTQAGKGVNAPLALLKSILWNWHNLDTVKSSVFCRQIKLGYGGYLRLLATVSL